MTLHFELSDVLIPSLRI